MVAGNYDNGDYIAYEKMYNNVFWDGIDSAYEIGYKLSMLVGRIVGLDYQTFYAVVVLIPCVLINRFILKFSRRPFLCLVLFSVIYLPLDYVLLRNFISFSLVLLGLEKVFENKKYAIGKFIFCTIIASTFHVSSFFYLIFIIGFLKCNLKISHVILLILISFPCFVFVSQKMVIEEATSRVEDYSVSFVYFVFLSLIQIINLIVVESFCRYKRLCLGAWDRNDYFILNMNILLLFLILPYWSVGIFVRVFRHVSIINVFYFLNILSFPIKNAYKYLMLVFLFVIYMLYFISFYIPTLDETLLSLFNYNILF